MIAAAFLLCCDCVSEMCSHGVSNETVMLASCPGGNTDVPACVYMVLIPGCCMLVLNS